MQKKFPKNFLWGASISAHQVEGGLHNQWSVWELENASSLAAQAEYRWGELALWPRIKQEAKNPDTYVSGKAADHYNRYEEDFAIVSKLGLNTLRFSVEWSRIEPEEGAWNAEAITYYRRYIQALKKRGVEPVMTLFHFTLPVWFARRGGFEKRSNISFFVRFAEKIMEEFGKDVRYIITINEPEVYAFESYYTGNWPPGVTNKWTMWRVLQNLAAAHNKTATMIHALGRRYKVSVAKHSCLFYPGDDAWLSVKSAALMQFFQDDYFLRKVIKTCDFLGVNYYLSNRVYGYRIHNPNVHETDLGWDASPADIQFVLERLHDKYKLPLIITENGIADTDDERRKWWLAQTITAMRRAMENGVRLEGYLHWSLLDNFEWDKGSWPRFGLVEVNYQTGERKIRPSARGYSKLVTGLLDR